MNTFFADSIKKITALWAKHLQLIKYGFWGVASTFINFILLALFTKMQMYYIIANVVSYSIAVVVSYFFNNFFVFKAAATQKPGRLLNFVLVRLLAIALDSLLLYIAVTLFALPLMASKAVLSIAIIMLTYLVNKTFVFGQNQKNLDINTKKGEEL